MTRRQAVIVDVDGTVALRGDRDPYDETTVDQDEPNLPVIAVVQAMHEQGYSVLFCSGRNNSSREATHKWLMKHVQIGYEELFMRTQKAIPDAAMKEQIYRELIEPHYEVVVVLDDRDQVVELWRSLGLTCLQVAPGAF